MVFHRESAFGIRSFVLVAIVFFPGFAALAANDTSCVPAALRALKKWDPNGYSIYQASEKGFLDPAWWLCPDQATSLATAVHETVHMLSHEKSVYPLIGGGSVPYCSEESMAPPSVVARQFDRSLLNVQTYLVPLRGAESSATQFCTLLDELNAYSHDLNTSVKLKHLKSPDGSESISKRDGVVAMMAFLKAYADHAKARDPRTWVKLNRDPLRKTIRTLWRQAEATLIASCGIPSFGYDDRYYYGKLCDRRSNNAISEIVGSAPACPSDCLDGGSGSSSSTITIRANRLAQ